MSLSGQIADILRAELKNQAYVFEWGDDGWMVVDGDVNVEDLATAVINELGLMRKTGCLAERYVTPWRICEAEKCDSPEAS